MKPYHIIFRLDGNPCLFRVLVAASGKEAALNFIRNAWSSTVIHVELCDELINGTVIIL